MTPSLCLSDPLNARVASLDCTLTSTELHQGNSNFFLPCDEHLLGAGLGGWAGGSVGCQVGPEKRMEGHLGQRGPSWTQRVNPGGQLSPATGRRETKLIPAKAEEVKPLRKRTGVWGCPRPGAPPHHHVENSSVVNSQVRLSHPHPYLGGDKNTASEERLWTESTAGD